MKKQFEESEASRNAYLWDGTGPVDLEIAALERSLAPLRYRPAKRRRGWIFFAAASVAAMAALLITVSPRQTVSSWSVADGGAAAPLRSGQVIATDAARPVRLHSAEFGNVTVEPNSRLRLLRPSPTQERFSLEFGTLRAFIWAPPAKFAVKTPSAMATDLGCVYTLQTDRRGEGKLTVEIGWVALESGGAESFIPAGAHCRIRERAGPGIPVYDDADPRFQRQVNAIGTRQAAPLAETLALARPKDALTLWHLILRTRKPERRQVVLRFADLVELPPDLLTDDLVNAQPRAMDTAWSALRLGSTEWWRNWKQVW